MSRIRHIPQRELLALLVIAVVGLVTIAMVFARAEREDWQYYQGEFQAIVSENLGAVDPAQIPTGIQQIWAEDLDRVDRCTTCHQGMFWQGLEGVEQPWSTHPRLELFEAHPVEDYGCTICHGGQGFALTEYEAHGYSTTRSIRRRCWRSTATSATATSAQQKALNTSIPPRSWYATRAARFATSSTARVGGSALI
jgi:hypothetical protein